MASKLFGILSRLDEAGVHYVIGRYAPDSVTITATLVGKRVEITVDERDDVMVSVFTGDEAVLPEHALDQILADFT